MFRIDDPTAAAALPAPEAAGTEAYFTEGNPGVTQATLVRASWLNMIQEELRAVVLAGGLTPSKTTYNQVMTAIKIMIDQQSGNYALDTGIANAYVIALDPPITQYTNGLLVRFRAAHTNTDASTLDAGGGAKSLKNDVGGALAPGDLPAGAVVSAVYDGPADAFLINSLVTSQALSQAAADVRYAALISAQQIKPIAASVAANALTVTLNPTSLDFRSSTLTSGAVNSRSVAAAITLTVPSTATLGTVSGQAARLALIALDNVGTIELAIANLAGGLNLDETTLISTTAMSTGATSAGVIYSTAARANVPFRVVGFIDSTQAAAGTWVSAPTTVQGAGGQAMSALSSLGYGQTLQTPARSLGTTYYNTTGRPILISVGVVIGAAGNVTQLTVNGVTMNGSSAYTGSATSQISFIIPPGASYSVVGSGTGNSLGSWIELR